MNDRVEPTPPRKQPPVLRYAIIIGVFAVAAILFGTLVGKNAENPKPSAESTPMAGASTGPSPRY